MLHTWAYMLIVSPSDDKENLDEIFSAWKIGLYGIDVKISAEDYAQYWTECVKNKYSQSVECNLNSNNEKQYSSGYGAIALARSIKLRVSGKVELFAVKFFKRL